MPAPERMECPLTYEEIYKSLSGLTALAVAEKTRMKKAKGEKDTEFIKRIVENYVFLVQFDPPSRT